MKIYIIPGYNSNQGEHTVDLLIEPLHRAGNEIVDVSYAGAEPGAIRQLYKTKSYQNHRVGGEIANKIMEDYDPVVIVAHSNGVAVTSYAIEALQRWGAGHRVKECILVHGALRRGYRWSVPVTNFYGKDVVLTVGANVRAAWSKTKCLLKHIFGDGCTGSRWGDYGAHPDLVSPDAINIETIPGHSEIFKTKEGREQIIMEILKWN